jgi:hypothetical protein
MHTHTHTHTHTLSLSLSLSPGGPITEQVYYFRITTSFVIRHKAGMKGFKIVGIFFLTEIIGNYRQCIKYTLVFFTVRFSQAVLIFFCLTTLTIIHSYSFHTSYLSQSDELANHICSLVTKLKPLNDLFRPHDCILPVGSLKVVHVVFRYIDSQRVVLVI